MKNFFNIFRSKNNIRNIKENSDKKTLDLNNIPKHIAIIMDGNGRWAKERNMPRTFGHKAGVETIRDIVKECSYLGVKYLTLYAFSTENWKRPKDEVNTLMNLLLSYLKNEFDELHENNVIINSIGDTSYLPKSCREELESAYKKTKNNTGLTLNLALNYGGRDEIISSIKKLYKDVENNKLNISDVNGDIFENYLDTKGMNDPEIIIRTSGEQRLSNFLLWQSSYSELWFTDTLWPDFTKEELRSAIKDYQGRERRFGGIK